MFQVSSSGLCCHLIPAFSMHTCSNQSKKKQRFLLVITFICCKGLYYLKRIREPEVRKFSEDEAFNVFKLESFNSESLTDIHVGRVGKVFYLFTAHFLLPWQAMVLSFVWQTITFFVLAKINIAFTIFYLLYCVGSIGRSI